MKIIVEAEDESENNMCDWFKRKIVLLQEEYDRTYGVDNECTVHSSANCNRHSRGSRVEYRDSVYTNSSGEIFHNGEMVYSPKCGLCGPAVAFDW